MRGALLLVLLAVLVACGDDAGPGAADAAVPADAAADAPPPADGSTMNEVCMGTGSPSGAHTLYLSFDGESLTKGLDDDATQNVSKVVKGAITVPAYRAAAANRAQLLADTVSAVADVLAPYDVQVVTARPSSGPYDMMVFGGDPLLVIGMAAIDPGVGPIDCAAAPSNVGFVYEATPPGNVAGAWTIVSYALMHGLPVTRQTGDCLCYIDDACAPSVSRCQLGRFAELDTNFCTPASGTVDGQQEFLDAFGCRP